MAEESDFVQDAKAATNTAVEVVDGVSSAFLLMFVPLVSIGIAVALGTFLVTSPVRIMNRRMN